MLFTSGTAELGAVESTNLGSWRNSSTTTRSALRQLKATLTTLAMMCSIRRCHSGVPMQ
jgi:hypothetical protein